MDVSAVEFLEPNMFTLSNFVYSTKIWFTRKVKFDKIKILGDNSQTKQCINFSVCAQWMIW